MPGLTTETPVQNEPEEWACEQCGEGWASSEAAENCCPEVFLCRSCDSEYSSEDDAYDCCRHYCPSCGGQYDFEDEARECCWHSCPDCGSGHEYEEDAMSCCRSSFHGSLPTLPETDDYVVTVPAIEGRPVRLCSLEQELSKGGTMVAALLYEQGWSTEQTMDRYHNGGSRPGSIHVEEDGSLPSEGGEVVYDRFNLSWDSDAETMGRCLTKIRQLRDAQSGPDRLVKTGYEAGVHVHISARSVDGSTTLGPHQVANLYEIWCYAEDMLYAFSAAGWDRHRQPADHYGGYCKPVPKALNASPREVWRLMRSDRYYGLNFQRLFEAVGRCSCGAATMGDWNACDCGAFDRATVEWRVFNASTRPETIHAWIVMAHAITAYAERHEFGTLQANPMGSTTPAEKREVLEHLLTVLPLTDGERELIRDTADRARRAGL